MKLKTKKTITLISVFTAIGVFLLGSYFYNKEAVPQQTQTPPPQSEFLERPHSPTSGPTNAPVTLVEFLDPECETCRAFHPYVKDILKQSNGKVRLVVRYLPFHKNSKFIVHILEAARKQNLFWETLDILFQNQPAWGDHHNPKPELVWDFLPSVAGLDIAQVKKELSNPDVQKIIDIDMQDALTVRAKYTPTFFVNGRPLPSFGLEQLVELVREEVAKAP